MNKGGFVGAVVTGPAVKIQRFLILGAGEQHHLVAALGLGDFLCVIQAFRSIAFSTEGAVRHHVFDESIGPDIPGQIGDNHTDAGGDDFPIHFFDDQMMIGVVEDLGPSVLDRKSVV